MITRRAATDRGTSNLGWLDSRHTFSFGGYHDPAHMGFRALRVVNEDRVAPGGGFGAHPHRDMEILSYVIDGSLEHRDSMGNGSVIRPGELQRMTAGTGITHSERNPSETEPVHFLQIWILPEARGLDPEYEQRTFPLDERRGQLLPLASRDGRDGSLVVHQDVVLLGGRLDWGDTVRLELEPGRNGWIQIVRGELEADGIALGAGDGASVKDQGILTVTARTGSELLFFDLP